MSLPELRPPKPEKKTSSGPDLDTPYTAWMRRPSPSNLNRVITAADPIVRSAITTYAGNQASPVTYGRARVLAAQAVKSYESDRGATLSTHLMNQLRPLTQYVQRESYPLKMSERRLRQLAELQRTEKEFYDTHGRDPSDVELSDRLGLSAKRLGRIRSYASPLIGPDPIDEDQSDPTIHRTDPIEVWMDYIYYDADDVDRRILDWKMGRNGQPVLKNLEIARRLQISPSAVSQRTARLQAKMSAIPSGLI